MDSYVLLLVFTLQVRHKEHLATHMNFDITTLHFGLLNCLEEFLSFQPNVSIVDDGFPLVEKLFLNGQSFISEKKLRNICVLHFSRVMLTRN